MGEQELYDRFKKLVDKSSGLEDGSFSLLSSRPPLECISTGSLAIDALIGPGCPGIPLGRLTQVFGAEQAGKSLLMCLIMAQAQKDGFPVFLVDREVHYTPEWFERFGGDAGKVVDLQPQTVEQCIDTLILILQSMEETNTQGGLFVIDSLQSLPTEKMFNADLATKEQLAASAKIFSDRLPGLMYRMEQAKLAVVSVGQIRDNPSPFARLEDRVYTPGGNALKHFTVLRLLMQYLGPILEKDENGEENSVGFTSRVSLVKNNVGGIVKGRAVDVDFMNYGGADDTNALFEIARKGGLISGGPTWFYYEDEEGKEVKFQGKKNWKPHCKGALLDRIKELAFDAEFQLKGTGYPGAPED